MHEENHVYLILVCLRVLISKRQSLRYVLSQRYARSRRLCESLLCLWSTLILCHLPRVAIYPCNIQCPCKIHHASIYKVLDFWFLTQQEHQKSMSHRLLHSTLSHIIHVTRNNPLDVNRISGHEKILTVWLSELHLQKLVHSLPIKINMLPPDPWYQIRLYSSVLIRGFKYICIKLKYQILSHRLDLTDQKSHFVIFQHIMNLKMFVWMQIEYFLLNNFSVSETIKPLLMLRRDNIVEPKEEEKSISDVDDDIYNWNIEKLWRINENFREKC